MGDSTVFVLVHSPLLGPSSWAWVAQELRDRGRSALVPALLGGTDAPWSSWHDIVVKAASPDRRDTVVLVGHSAAGTLLPAIADSIPNDVAGLVFVDAFLPPSGGAAQLVPAQFIDNLRALATDDVLPPWSTWFGETAMRELVPDAPRRAEVAADMPRMPLSSLLAPVPIPERWARDPCAYVLLSAQYAASAAEARTRGWPLAEIPDGKHLDSIRRPTAVTDALLAVERAMTCHG
ncbi:MAG: alpha/beta hydrolase [Solirubrobacteraceae bacterium]